MTWTHIAHSRCIKPLFPFLTPSGSIWTCDRCGKRWMLDREGDGDQRRIVWRDMSTFGRGAMSADEIRASMSMLSMEPADVARREMASAQRWFDYHVQGVWASLGLERPS